MTEPAIVLGANQYGKAEVRVVKVTRDTARHEIDDLNVTSQLRGDFAAAHLAGDNAHVVADRHAEEHDLRVRPRRHRIARGVPAAPRRPLHELVRLGHAAAGGRPSGTRGSASVGDGAQHDHAFVRSGQEVRTAVVVADGAERHVLGGLKEPHGAEDHRVGVRGLPEGPVHDAAGDHRPHPRDGCRGALALRRRATRRSTTTPSYDERADAAARGVRREVLGGAADDPVRHGQPRARAAPRDRRDPLLDAEQAPLRRRPRARSGSTTRTRCSSPPTAPTDSSRRP